jgi:hypothetical protein
LQGQGRLRNRRLEDARLTLATSAIASRINGLVLRAGTS